MEAYRKEMKAKIATVNRAIQSQNGEKLLRMADKLKQRVNELSDDIKSLKADGRKVQRLEYDVEEILDSVDNLQIKLDAETSSPNPDDEKIIKFTNEKEDLNKKHKKIERQVKRIKENTASAVEDTETLEIKIDRLNEYGNMLQRIKDALNEEQA